LGGARVIIYPKGGASWKRKRKNKQKKARLNSLVKLL
jgi:hypothetical protein